MHKHIKMPNKYLLVVFGIFLLGGSFFAVGYENKIFPFQKMDKDLKTSFKTMKIGLINDLHAVSVQKKGEELRLVKDYQRRLDSFSQKTNVFSPDIIVANGDMIDGTRQTSEIAIKELGFVRDFFEKNFMVQKFWTIGNHELRAVNRDQWREGLGIDYDDKIFENEAYKIIFLDSAFGSGGKSNDSDGVGTELLVSDDQLAWLERELNNSNKIKIIFTHFPPLIGEDVKIGYAPIGVENLQKLFSKSGVSAVFSGHVETTLHKKIDNVDYYILPGISKNKIYENAFTRIRMIDGRAVVNIIYNDESGEYVIKMIE